MNVLERPIPDHAIAFYASNRFFLRNVAEMDPAIRMLRKHGIELADC